MNPFRQAILEVKNDPVRIASIEASFPTANLSIRIISSTSGDHVRATARMAACDDDAITPQYGLIGPQDQGGFSLTAWRGDRLIGQISIRLYDNGCHVWPEEHSIWASAVFVDANHRCEGVGSELVDAASATLKAIILRAQEIDPCAWEWIDPHPGADMTDISRRLLSRLAADFGAFNDDLCVRMTDELERVAP